MDNEKIEFPKYEQKNYEKPNINSTYAQQQSYYINILKDWQEYLNSIPDTIFNSSMSGIIKNITYYINRFIEKKNVQLLQESINDINSNLTLLKKCHDSNDEVKFSNHLINILSTVITINNFYISDEWESKYSEIEAKNSFVRENLDKSLKILKTVSNTLSATNLKGLAGEFEHQYKKYNKERIFWSFLSLSILLMILFRIFIFEIIYVNSLSLLMYLCFILFIVSYLNDTFIDDIVTTYNNMIPKIIDKYNWTPLKYIKTHFTNDGEAFNFTEPVKYISAIVCISIFLYCYSTENIFYLQLFRVELIDHKFNNWQELIPQLFIYIPMFWLLWFSIKQYHYTTKLMNAYRFKMALSLAYNGYKEECLGSDHKDHLLHDVLSVIADDPTKRDFKDTHMPWSEFKEYLNITERLVNKNNSNKQS